MTGGPARGGHGVDRGGESPASRQSQGDPPRRRLPAAMGAGPSKVAVRQTADLTRLAASREKKGIRMSEAYDSDVDEEYEADEAHLRSCTFDGTSARNLSDELEYRDSPLMTTRVIGSRPPRTRCFPRPARPALPPPGHLPYLQARQSPASLALFAKPRRPPRVGPATSCARARFNAGGTRPRSRC